MPKFSESYGGQWMKAETFPVQGMRGVILEITEEEIGRGSDKKTKLVCWLKGEEKGWVVNKTNGTILAEIFGDETDAWAGKRIVLKRGTTLFEAKKVPSIQVDEDATRAANEPGGPSKKAATPVTQAEADSDIPW